MSMIRKIKRNISEAATNHRRPRYWDAAKHRQSVKGYIAGLFNLDEYLKHKPHQKALFRAVNEERNQREYAAIQDAL